MMKNLNLTDLNLSDAFGLFLSKNNFAKSTIRNHTAIFKTFLDFIAKNNADHTKLITSELITRFIQAITQTKSAQNTQNSYLKNTKYFLAFLFKQNLIPFDPAFLFPKFPKTRFHLSPNDFEIIAPHFANQHQHLAILSLFACENLLPCDIYALTINDVFFNKIRIKHKQLILNLSQTSAKHISNCLEHRVNSRSNALFIWQTGTKISLLSIRKIRNTACFLKKYGI